MFRIKVCGITTPNDAEMAVAAGADAIGLNFYPLSPRYVTPEKARQIIAAVPPEVVLVGLFVNEPADFVCETFDQLGLDLIQLHGDEPPEFLATLGPRPVMWAFRMGPEGLGPAVEYLNRCRAAGCLPRLLLIDAYRPGQYGGTGKVADWSSLRDHPARTSAPPLVLAGGLTTENVAEAIRAVRPAAVDAASGVESSPGRKDSQRVKAFVRAARRAFEQTM